MCASCGCRHPVAVTCGRRTCPDCARRRYHKLKKKYEPLQKHLRAPKLLTLTLKRYPIGHEKDDVADLVDRIVKAFKLLRRRTLCDHVRGGFYAIEIKPPEPERDLGWYVHLHALWDGPRIPQERLSDAWEELTGDSPVADIRECRKPDSAVSYVLGYTTAGPKIEDDWADQDEDTRKAFEDAIKSRRLLQTFGHLHGKQTAETAFACPNCDARDWIVLDLNPHLHRLVGAVDWRAMTPEEIHQAKYGAPDRPPPAARARPEQPLEVAPA